eukprot:TRINITY_DN3411_c0_g2_i9.p1 TRINITY_DN3411_c0_g2~~TRINITY_DN3411_c0_g2_i9.p1  ORF type:complete len:986 (+),score=268.04 TRINITY_DN3411_c0_g2_i9:116-3073(+)
MYGYSLAPEKIRLWKLASNTSAEQFLSYLNANLYSLKHRHFESADASTEENSGVEFPGTCLDFSDGKKSIAEFKVIIEQADDKGCFMFRLMKNVVVGRCDSCYTYKPLIYQCRCKLVTYCSTRCKENDWGYHEDRCTMFEDDNDLSMYQMEANSNRGLTGLKNLGNTCFMNSGLQCLSNTFLLTKYFLDDQYKDEINAENPLGIKGALARSYAKLVKILWTVSRPSISPGFFKRAVGSFRAVFSSHSQQDSQELITAVLDGLHEDLNRVCQKPYVEFATSNDPAKDAIAADSWYCHLARNQSVIVDLMYGQYKSVLKCPSCARYSVTFDPFSTITLPIPSAKQRLIVFFYVPYNTARKITKHSLPVAKGAKIEDLRAQVAEKLGVSKDGSTFTMVSRMAFDRFLCRDLKASVIEKTRYSDLYVQEINPKYFNGPENEGIEKRKEEYKKDEEVSPPSRNNNVYLYGEQKKSKVVDHNDYNSGLSDNMLRVAINIYKKVRSVYNYSYLRPERATFSRLIHVKRSHTLKELHMEVFSYFRPFIEKSLRARSEEHKNHASHRDTEVNQKQPNPNTESGKDLNEEFQENSKEEEKGNRAKNDFSGMSDEEFFAKLFPDMESNWKEELDRDVPYELRLIRTADRYFDRECHYCGKINCGNCLVPYSDNVTVQDLLNRNKTPHARNDYFYKEYRGYASDRKEFELEVIFKEDCELNMNYLEQIKVSKDFSEKAKEQAVTIYDCFDQFSNWEKLDENNLWYCPTCKNFVQASKRIEIFRTPPVLILNLKRFEIKHETSFVRSGERLNTFVEYPLENLDLSGYVHDRSAMQLYDLYAVSNHYGSTSFGHYTAFALNDGVWRKFDDSVVAKIDPSEVCSTAGYVLFYKRKDIKADTDIRTLRQSIPEGYELNIIELKPKAKTNSVLASQNVEEEKGSKSLTTTEELKEESKGTNNEGREAKEQNEKGKYEGVEEMMSDEESQVTRTRNNIRGLGN